MRSGWLSRVLLPLLVLLGWRRCLPSGGCLKVVDGSPANLRHLTTARPRCQRTIANVGRVYQCWWWYPWPRPSLSYNAFDKPGDAPVQPSLLGSRRQPPTKASTRCASAMWSCGRPVRRSAFGRTPGYVDDLSGPTDHGPLYRKRVVLSGRHEPREAKCSHVSHPWARYRH